MKKIYHKIVITILILFIGLVLTIFALQIINCQKIAWGVKIGGLKINVRQPQTAQQVLENKWDEFINQEIDFLNQENHLSTQIANFGFEINLQQTIDQAYQISRQSNFFNNIKEQLIALMGYRNTPVIYTINIEEFDNQVAEIFKDIEKPAQNALLIFNEEINDFSLQHSTTGTAIDKEQLLDDLFNRLQSFSNNPIELKLLADYPEIKNNEVDSALEKVQQILASQPYYLIFNNESWTINKETIIDWLKFEPIKENETDPAESKLNGVNNQILGVLLDRDKIEKYLDNIAKTINRPPIDAQLETEENRAIVFNPAQEGFEIKKTATIDRLITNILLNPPIKKTTIIADKASPKIALKNTNNLGINTLIGQGISNFTGSPKNRVHNIKTGAAKFNGLILTPNEEFSFNNLLGGSGPEQGFLPELVIKNHQTIPEYGGGLCQISTTFFRAAANSGMKITERRAHAFPVVYYSPQGFDATIYEPKPDFRFINNTPAHLLIQAIVEGTQLAINFYATDDGRKVGIEGPYVLERKEDGSMKTVLTQKVYQNGEITEEQIFYSNYDSPDLYTTPAN